MPTPPKYLRPVPGSGGNGRQPELHVVPPELRVGSPLSRAAAALGLFGYTVLPHEDVRIDTGSGALWIPKASSGSVRLLNPQTGMVAEVTGYMVTIWHCQNGTPGRGKQLTVVAITDCIDGANNYETAVSSLTKILG